MSLLWKLGIGAVIAGALFLLVRMYGGKQYELGAANDSLVWQAKVLDAEKGKLAAYQAGVASVHVEDARYVETVRDRIIPITRTIVERSTAYASTPDGASQCLPAERVLWLDQTRSSLFPSTAAPDAGGAGDAVRPDTAVEGTGRLNDESASRAEPGSGGRGPFRLRSPTGSWSEGMAKVPYRR